MATESAETLWPEQSPRVGAVARGATEVAVGEFDLPLRAADSDLPDEPDVLRDIETPDEEPVRRSGIDLTALDRDLEGMACPSRPVEAGAQDEVDTEWEPPEPDAFTPSPVARPALASERVGAAAIDVGLLALIGMTVVYFASRVARVPFSGLWPAWPWFGAWLVGVGLAYSAVFTGTTGQTLGKIATGLRVVDASDHPPSYGRAFLRAIVGFVGVLVVCVGFLPSVFDPARRALHDRCFRTRVVRG